MSYKFVTGSVSIQGDLEIDSSLTAKGEIRAKDDLLSGSALHIGAAQISETEMSVLDGATLTTTELNLLDDITRGSLLAGTSAGSAELVAKTSGQILVGDGTDVLSVAVSGDISLAANGAVTIAAGAVEHSMLAEDIISGQNAVASIAQADLIMIDDGPGEVKKATFSDFEDSIFGNISGDATVAAGGALTIAADAVEPSMMSIFDDSLAATDTHIMIADGTDYSSFAVSGDATLSNAGVLTIAANAVEGSMINSNAAGEGIDYAGSALVLKLSELTVAAGAVQADDEFAAHNAAGANQKHSMTDIAAKLGGAGLASSAGVLSLNIDGLGALGGVGVDDADAFAFSDGGTEKKLVFSNLYGAVFGKISGDATVAAGGGLTIAAGAVEHGMLAENIISGQDELAHADIVDADELMISDGGVIKRVGVDSLQNHYFGAVSGDATIADGGALTIAANAVEGSMLNSNTAGSGVEYAGNSLNLDFNGLGGSDGFDAANDSLAIIDASDSNKTRKESIADLVAGIAGAGLTQNGTSKKLEISSAAVKVHTDNTQALVEGINVYTSATNVSLTLPGAAEAGDQIVVKARTLNAGQKLTIAKNDSHNKQIDGLDSIKLVESFSAVTMVYISDAVGWAII